MLTVLYLVLAAWAAFVLGALAGMRIEMGRISRELSKIADILNHRMGNPLR
jgi:hypothetical protein